jgi:hypothetical protein
MVVFRPQKVYSVVEIDVGDQIDHGLFDSQELAEEYADIIDPEWRLTAEEDSKYISVVPVNLITDLRQLLFKK